MGSLVVTYAFIAPDHVATGQERGGYADSLLFSLVPQDQVVGSLSQGEVDLYLTPLDTATDKEAARDDPNVQVMEAYGGFFGILANPTEPSDGSFNPFAIREIREAQQWAYDRELLVTISGGFGIPMWTRYLRGEPEFIRDVAFFLELERTYAYDPARAKAQVDDAMSFVPGASFDAATEKWLMNGNEIEVIIIQRVEDIRFEIGGYIASVIESWGFTPVLDASTFSEALTKVYFSEPKIGQWSLYTEGWGGGAVWNQYANVPSPYVPPPSLCIGPCDPPDFFPIPCDTLADSSIPDPDERRDLVRACILEGMKDGTHIFLQARTRVYATNAAIGGTVFDLSSGLQQPFSVRTSIKAGQPGGTLKIGQPVHTGSVWNAYGGFQDWYSLNQLHSLTDPGVAFHPHLGTMRPMRSEFMVNNVGPLATHEVPSSALTFDADNNTFVSVGANVTSGAFVDFELTFGEWHHGSGMSMDDVLGHIAMLSRMADGDLATVNPNNAAQIYLARWTSSFRGLEILGAESIRVYFDAYSHDQALIAKRSDVFPWYPWELSYLMAESVLSGDTSLDDTSADLLGNEPLDLAKGPSISLLDPLLASNRGANTVPSFLAAFVTPDEATNRWNALHAWRHDPSGCIDGPSTWTCNYFVSQGPYVLDAYYNSPEGASYRAKRSGYPLPQDAWDYLSEIRVPEVILRHIPEVIQLLPAAFEFVTVLGGAPYEKISTAAWFLWDPTTKSTLLRGDPIRTGQVKWEVQLTATQTAILGDGSYELWIIVLGEEAAVPVAKISFFTALSLGTAVMRDVDQLVDGWVDEIAQIIDEGFRGVNHRIEENQARVEALSNQVNALLIVALAGLGGSVASIGTLILVRRRGSRG